MKQKHNVSPFMFTFNVIFFYHWYEEQSEIVSSFYLEKNYSTKFIQYANNFPIVFPPLIFFV